MLRKFTCAALILALTLAACGLAETPFGLVPGLNWEDAPETALELLGPEATLDSFSDMQFINATIGAPFDIKGEALELSLLYWDDALQAGILFINDAGAQPYIDATTALCGAPVILGENEYWLLDAFDDTTKAVCYWKVDDMRCFILEEATEQNENPDIRTLIAFNFQDFVDDLLESQLSSGLAPQEITLEDMFFTQPEEYHEEASSAESE